MSKLFNLKDVEIEGYYFVGYEGIYWHSCYFWDGEKQLKIIYNNGSKAILINNRKKSIKQLRLVAHKCTIKLLKYKIPF